MQLKLPDLLILLLIFQLLFASAYLFLKSTINNIGNKLLGCFFLSIALAFADNLLLRTGFWFKFPYVANFSSAFPLLYGPLLFLYTLSIIYKNFRLSKSGLVHFLPVVLLFTISFFAWVLQPIATKVNMLHTISQHRIAAYWYVGALFMIGHFSVYAISSLLLIKQYKAAALNRFSSTQKINLGWLSSTIIFFLILFALALVNNAFQFAKLSRYYDIALFAILLLLFYFVNRMLFKALLNHDYFSWLEPDAILAPEIPKQHLETHAPETKQELEKLISFMDEHKPFFNPDLTIEMFAKSMHMPTKEVSRLINVYLNQNFFDFVNRYRIKEAQHLLLNSPDKKTTVLEILYKTGFNSKSSFNTLFKKYTGLTPTEFKKSG